MLLSSQVMKTMDPVLTLADNPQNMNDPTDRTYHRVNSVVEKFDLEVAVVGQQLVPH